MSSASLPELAGTLFPPISRPRSRTPAFLASDITVSVLIVRALRRTQALRQDCERSSPNPGDSSRLGAAAPRTTGDLKEEVGAEVVRLAAARADLITRIERCRLIWLSARLTPHRHAATT